MSAADEARIRDMCREILGRTADEAPTIADLVACLVNRCANSRSRLPQGTPISTTEMLRVAAKQLSQSERGRDALANLQRLFIDGGSGLDATNKGAAFALFMAMLCNPWDWPAELTNPDKRP